jgi:pimeloyl-ACP methyl ester carboxylesterase
MTKPDLPPDIAAPLAPFKGQKPPAPKWFDDAIADAPERFTVDSDGAAIECLAWGERGKPGLVLVHGASAHADWWSYTAPFFAKDYRVAALSLSGMGGSAWRERYAFDLFAGEVDACARAAGLYESGSPPVYIGHSFGGAVVYYAALAHPDRMAGAILVDTGFGRPPPNETAADAAKEDVPETRTTRVYPTLEAALARFRFLPSQSAGHLYAADFIARTSLKRAPMEGGGEGWTWRFDPNLFPKLDRSTLMTVAGREPGPCFHIYGDRSKVIEYSRQRPRMLADSVKEMAIPDSGHHIMVDQPLALVAALRAVLSHWP